MSHLLGLALFDINGLPLKYFVTDANPGTDWVQIVFQALGLRSLLVSSLELEGFQQIVINLQQKSAIVVRRRHDYVALLIGEPLTDGDDEAINRISRWIGQLDVTTLNQHPHFHAA